MTAVAGVRDTDRLRLEPIGPEHAGDLWGLHQDDAVAAWHAGPWSVSDAHRNAAAMARAWATDGVGKWIAYDRRTGELVGRGLVEGRDEVHDGARFVLYARGRGR